MAAKGQKIQGGQAVTPSPNPPKTTKAGVVHTHPPGYASSNGFSNEDIDFAWMFKIGGKNGKYLPVYLAAPNGDVLRYEKDDGWKYDIVIYSGTPFEDY